MKKYDVIIIGAGPSGLMTATQIKDKSVLLLDANDEIGGKLKVTGGGRCNVTNNKSIDSFLNNVPKNQKFLYSTLNNFSPSDIINFFEENKVKLKEEDHGRMFTKSNDYRSITNLFTKLLRQNKVKTQLNYLVTQVVRDDNHFIINDEYYTEHLVIATGGISYKQFNTTGFGYQVAKEFDIEVTDLDIVEAPLVSNDQVIQDKLLQALSLKDARLSVFVDNKEVFSDKHDLVFTHFGISGPLALRSSYYCRCALKENKNVKVVIDTSGIDNVPRRLKKLLIEDKIELTIHDVRGSSVGFITSGGIKLNQISPQSFETKKIEKLYFIGEVLDVHGFTGGYNLSICFSEGYSLAQYLNNN